MECPHCGAACLLGATVCFNCGGAIFADAPATEVDVRESRLMATQQISVPRAVVAQERDVATQEMHLSDLVPESPPPAPKPAALPPSTTLCRVCLSPYPVLPGSKMRGLCVPCGGGPQPVTEEIVIAGSLPYPGQQRRPAAESRRTRRQAKPRAPRQTQPTPPARPSGFLRRTILVLVLLGLLGGAAGMALKDITQRSPTEALLQDVEPVASRMRVIVPGNGTLEFETHFSLRVLREQVRGSFSTELEPRVDLLQDTLLSTQIVLVDRRSAGDVIDVASEFSVVSQEGHAERVDADGLRVHPWTGHRGTKRLIAPPRGRLRILGEGAASPGRDAPPLLTLGVIGAGREEVEPLTKWKADVVLPLLADRNGGVFVHSFHGEFTYLGRRSVYAHDCVAVRFFAVPNPKVPDVLRPMDAVRGEVHGALFYDSRTGLLVRADLRANVRVEAGSRTVHDRVRVSGRLVVTRK